jgi:uracil phosphoribosyltransferase
VELTIVDHPLAADRLTTLRDAETPAAEFRAALHELSVFLLYEALRSCPVATIDVETPLGPTTGDIIAQPPVLVPVLRAGLGMLEAGRTLLPDAPVGFVGAKRDEDTFQPKVYMQTVPMLDDGPAIVLDPMLATGGSMIHACELLRERDAGPIIVVCVLAAPEGIDTLGAAIENVHVVTASVDEYLTDNAYIYPGLGDAGDRQFGID